MRRLRFATTIALALFRSYRLNVFVLLAAILCLASVAVPGYPISVPLRQDVLAQPGPLVLATLAAFLPIALTTPDAQLVAAMTIQPWLIRFAVAMATSAVALLVLICASALSGRAVGQPLRNYAIAASLTLLLSLTVRVQYVWIAPLALILVNWLYGVDQVHDGARFWAIFMYGASLPWLAMSVSLWCVSIAAWVVIGPLEDRRLVSAM